MSVEEHEARMESLLERITEEPGCLAHHRAAHACAKRRKIAGGRPLGVLARWRMPRSTPVERFVAAERRWLYSPMDFRAWEKCLRAASRMVAMGRMAPVVAWLEEQCPLGELTEGA